MFRQLPPFRGARQIGIDPDKYVGIGPSAPRVTLQELQNPGCCRSRGFMFLHAFESKLSTLQKQKPDDFSSGFAVLAVRTGLEQKF